MFGDLAWPSKKPRAKEIGKTALTLMVGAIMERGFTMVNYVEITGNLIFDPEFYEIDELWNEDPLCTFYIDCEQSEDNNAYFSCFALKELAFDISKNYIAGMPIHLWGRLVSRVWQDRNGDYHATTEIMVQKASHGVENEHEQLKNDVYNKKTLQELKDHRRAVELLFREKYGSPKKESLFFEDELKGIPPIERKQYIREVEEEWFGKKGIPNPDELVSQDEKDNLSIEELDKLLEERSDEWFAEAWREQSELTEKNLGRYFLEQSIIPDRLFVDDGKAFIVFLLKKQGALLLSLLRIYENFRSGGGYECPYQAEQFIVKTQRMRTNDNTQEFEMLVIEMPEPESVPLCSHLIICYDSKLDHIRYYTVEKAIGREHFMLCEINENKMHLNHGDAPDSFPKIIEKVRKQYSSFLVN